jgi:hypothetical protein
LPAGCDDFNSELSELPQMLERDRNRDGMLDLECANEPCRPFSDLRTGTFLELISFQEHAAGRA